MENQPEVEVIIQAEATSLNPEDKAWLDYYADEQRKTPARLEEVAKYITGIISICLTIFIDKKPPNLAWWTIDGLTLASMFWVVAVVMTFSVMFPIRYIYNDSSLESIKSMHIRIVKRKYRLLIVSGLLFTIGLLIGLYIFRYGYQTPTPPH